MSNYKDDLSQEHKPSGIIAEGERAVRILEMIEGKSKSGNRMFTTTIEDIKTKTNMTVWLVAEPKKRWMLKSLLNACQVTAGADGVYDWSVKDVIGKTVSAIVEHFQDTYINKEAKEVTATKARVTEFLLYVPPQTINGEEVQWKD